VDAFLATEERLRAIYAELDPVAQARSSSR
jgi:hypothetical protein